MSTTDLQRAKHFIDQKRYIDARNILMRLEHPTAKKWLAQLDRIAPVKKSQPIQAHLDEEMDALLDSLDDIPDSMTMPPTPPLYESLATETYISDRPYDAVQALAIIYYLLGAGVVLLGLYLGFRLLEEYQEYSSILTSFGSDSSSAAEAYRIGAITLLVVTLITAITFWAIGQLMQIVVELVKNSRSQIELLEIISERLSQQK